MKKRMIAKKELEKILDSDVGLIAKTFVNLQNRTTAAEKDVKYWKTRCAGLHQVTGTKIRCPLCGGSLTVRTNNANRGQFIGCDRYFAIGCTYTEKIDGGKKDNEVLNAYDVD